MMHMKKLMLLLAALLALGTICALAEEAEPTVYTSGEWECVLREDGTAEIKGYNGSDTELNIPAQMEGRAVTVIGRAAFRNCASLTAVRIPSSVTTIGEYAFYKCSALSTIHCPDSVAVIGRRAFFGCQSLSIFRVPDSVVSIGSDAFSSCESLTLIIPKGSYASEYQGEYGFPDVLGCLFYTLLEDGTAEVTGYTGTATELTIPDGFTAIGEGAFSALSSLTSIMLPDGVTTIGNSAFSNCTGLTSIVLPDGVTTIGERAFSGCTSLTSITIPDGVTTIGERAFAECYVLTSITLPDSVTAIGNDAFHLCFSLTSITLPDSVTAIGERAFSDCYSLTSIMLPDGVTAIGANPFARCVNLMDIIVSPDHPTLATIDGVLFDKEEKKLICYPCAYTNSSYAVPQGIRAIGDYAFNYCSSLTGITLPDSVTSIGDRAFDYCSSLTSITVSRDSYAAQWCKENNLRYTYPDANDWLLN